MLLLDTDVLSALMKKQVGYALLDRLKRVPSEEIFISAMTRSEILYGLALMPEQQNAKAMKARDILHLYRNRCLPFDTGTADVLASIRAEARSRGDTLPTADSIIAATAIRHRLLLLTGNLRHFERIPHLQVDNPLEQNSC